MKTMHAHLRLSTSKSDKTRERCPDVVFLVDGEVITSFRTDVEEPQLPMDDGHLDSLVLHDDALSRVIDEEIWLREFARVLQRGGDLRFTLPAAGVLAWLDPMNAYRYITDVSRRGDAPNAALPTGWNRHYSKAGIQTLLQQNGFEAPSLQLQNHAVNNARMLLGLIRHNWLKRDQDTELQLFPQYGRRNPDEKSSKVGTTWSITTVRKR